MKTSIKHFVLMTLMVGAALAAPMLRATNSLADQRPPIDLENMVPRQFGEWREQTGLATQLVDPEMQANVDRLYSATLSRTYVNPEGYRIMVSIAYGKEQRRTCWSWRDDGGRNCAFDISNDARRSAAGAILVGRKVGIAGYFGSHPSAVCVAWVFDRTSKKQPKAFLTYEEAPLDSRKGERLGAATVSGLCVVGSKANTF